ncbi:hypothetical protein HPC49_02130 [Pyxidicoccus fallax]|uniref:Uncharacterized protein n=1 Tax=Pyxidicoccus fallax TaxID=394095 RepID=A0A848L8F9_9BACT|nr:hypothetical protein [Pyxidicoccus fallax]NMO14532.1 hypothetical protein [Pyxidicoccus fallax]NPC77051.1 hypothetical protein [Pyxidicoccus fallax]
MELQAVFPGMEDFQCGPEAARPLHTLERFGHGIEDAGLLGPVEDLPP